MANKKTLQNEIKKDFKFFKTCLPARQEPRVKKILIITGVILFSIGTLIFIFNLSYRNRIFPQTYIGGINVGGKNKTQAEAILKAANESSQKNQINLNYLDKNWQIKTSELNANVNVSDSVSLAWGVGRAGSFKKVIAEQFKSLIGGNFFLAAFNIDSGKLNDQIIKISNDVDAPEKDAGITIDNNLKVQTAPEQYGRKLDLSDTQLQILNVIGNFSSKDIVNLKVDSVVPKVTASGATDALSETTQILANTLTLSSTNKNYTLSPNNIAPLIEYVAAPIAENSSGKVDLTKTGTSSNDPQTQWHLIIIVDQAKVAEYLNTIASEINQDPQDAKFQVTNGQVTTFQTSQTGYKLDIDKSKVVISTAILNKTPSVKLAVTVTQPAIASDSASTMGLNEMVGDGKTSWRGSPANRIHNLSLGASNISGTIVKPGEEFSTVKAIGPIDGAHGFLQELVIKNSTQVVPDFGGGLCQVSTTLFRAALNAGLKITARTNHSFRVSYYEPPVGMDATIYDPAPDFKFVNTYSTPILIWGIAGNNGLEFQIFGTKDGRVVNLSTPTVGDFVSPPPDNYQESDTMDPGTVRQVEKALQGCTASFHYSVTDASGKSLENQTFVSKYVALANSYLYGPGYVPPGQ